jgi:dienelactone hydrolase
VALAVVAAACARPRPQAPVAPPGPAAEVREVDLDQGRIHLRLEIPPAPGPKPAVIGASDDRPALLAEGAVVITVTLDWQLITSGASAPAGTPMQPTGRELLMAPSDPRRVGEGFFQMVGYQARTATPRVLDYLTTLSDIDPARIGITGTSTGGFIALQAVAIDARLAAAAAHAACGDYRTFLQLSTLGTKGNPLVLDGDYDAWLDTQDPFNTPDRLVHAAVLMVNGVRDHVVPPDCATATAVRLQAAYDRAGVPERFRYVLIGGHGHVQDAGTLHQVLAWWQRWLLRPASLG